METNKDRAKGNENDINVVFFIDKQQFKTNQQALTVRQLLVDFAKEDPQLTTLVLRHGNDLKKLTNLDEVIHMENGMKFLVYHNTPTTVSSHVRS